MPLPKTKAQYEKELRNNIRLFNQILGEGLGADDEIIVKNMLSDERMQLHEDYQNVEDTTDTEHINKKITNASKYFQAGSVPKPVKRNWGCFAHEEKTQADIDHNKRMFSNLSRDDEMGEMARENYFIENLNNTFKLDPETFKQENLDKMSEREFADYCAKNADTGYIMFELQHGTEDFVDEFTITNKDKFQAAHRYATTVGSVLKDNTRFVKSDGFLTVPLQYMTDKQIERMYEATSRINPLFSKEQAELINKSLNLEIQKRQMSAAVDELRSVIKPGEIFTTADYKYTLPIEERQCGGYFGRKDAILQGCDAINSLNNDDYPEGLEAIKQASEKVKNAFESVDGTPNEQQQEQIINSIKNRNKLIYQYNKVLSKSEDSNVLATRDMLKKNMTISGYLTWPNVLKDQIAYAKEDMAEFAKYGDGLDKSLEELNALYDGLRVVNPDGQKETMLASDIYEIRNKMAEVIKKADNAILNDGVSKTVSDKFSKIKDSTLRQLKAMNRAEPGMTIDDALAGNARKMDISGHNFDVVGNAMSHRQMMSVTGADGARTAGFFTENKKINMDAMAKDIENNFVKAYPNADKKLIGMVVNELKSTNDIQFYHAEDFEAKNGITLPHDIKDMLPSMKEQMVDAATQVDDYKGMIFAPDDAVISARNIAMSDVAALVGAGDCLAKSTPLTVVNNGKAVEGCFMEAVQGEDLDHLTQDSPFFKVKDVNDILDYSPALKQLADMQAIDFICGNRDRHGGNIMYQFDEAGKLIGVKGIDNDASFMSIDQAVGDKMTAPENMKYISASMAEKLEHTTPEMLKMTLEGSGLFNTEMDFAVDRFNQLKNAIKDNKIQVMPDDEFAKHKAEDFYSKDGPATIFKNVHTKFNEKVTNLKPEEYNKLPQTKQPRKENVVDMFREIDSKQVSQTIEPLEHLFDDIKDANKKVYFGSKLYANIGKTLEMVIEASKKMSEVGQLANAKTFDALDKAYHQLEKCCDNYVKSKIGVGKSIPGPKTAKRVGAAIRVREFCRNMSKSLEKTIEMDKSLEAKKNDKVARIMIDNLDPQTAGMYLREMNKVALGVNSNPKQILEAAQQIKTVAKYMQEKHISAEQCGLTKDDMVKAQNSIKVGRKVAEQLNPQAQQKQVEKKEQGMQLS